MVFEKNRNRLLKEAESEEEGENRIQRLLGHEGFPSTGCRKIQGDERDEQDEKSERRVFPLFSSLRVEKVAKTERHEGDSKIDDSRVPF